MVKLPGGKMAGYRSIEPNLQADASVYRKSYRQVKTLLHFPKHGHDF